MSNTFHAWYISCLIHFTHDTFHVLSISTFPFISLLVCSLFINPFTVKLKGAVYSVQRRMYTLYTCTVCSVQYMIHNLHCSEQKIKEKPPRFKISNHGYFFIQKIDIYKIFMIQSWNSVSNIRFHNNTLNR